MLGEYLAQLLTNLIPIYQLKWQSVPAFAKVTAQNLAFLTNCSMSMQRRINKKNADLKINVTITTTISIITKIR